MIDRNGPGFIKTESRSPMIASGVATPKQASTNMTTVIAIPAISPASNPTENAFDLLMKIVDLTKSAAGVNRNPEKCRNDSRARDKCSAQCAGNFGDAAGATTMIDQHFENPQTSAGDFHLHF